jgi:hypothetical protein
VRIRNSTEATAAAGAKLHRVANVPARSVLRRCLLIAETSESQATVFGQNGREKYCNVARTTWQGNSSIYRFRNGNPQQLI